MQQVDVLDQEIDLVRIEILIERTQLRYRNDLLAAERAFAVFVR